MYEDKTLVCKDCGNEFVFTAGEQEFYAEKAFVNEPQRCKDCRNARKQHQEDREKCMMLSAQAAEPLVRFRFSQRKTDLYTAVNAFAKMRARKTDYHQTLADFGN